MTVTIPAEIAILNPHYSGTMSQVISNSHFNGKLITYPIGVSTATYGIDQFIENFNVHEPSTTQLGKIVDLAFGWGLNDKGERNPSILDRICNFFSKKKNEEFEKEKLETSTGKIIHHSSSYQSGEFGVSYWQNGCSVPSHIEGHWEMKPEIQIPFYMYRYSNEIYRSINKCLAETVLKEYFASFSEFCSVSNECGCSGEIELFSFRYENKFSLCIYKTDTKINSSFCPVEHYPFPNSEKIDVCLNTVLQGFCNKMETNVITEITLFSSGMIIISSLFMLGCCFIPEITKTHAKRVIKD